MRPEIFAPRAARAGSCSKAGSHCPGKAAKAHVRPTCPPVVRGQKRVEDARERAYDPRIHRPSQKGFCEDDGIAGSSPAMTTFRLHRCAARRTAAQIPSRAPISQPRAEFSTKGKPPGGDPAAPVRRRSCRGAGSATAGARLGYMVTTGVVRQGDPCPACPYRIGAGPSCGAFRRRHVRGTSRRVPRVRGTRPGPGLSGG
jgi:hypothetical protein